VCRWPEIPRARFDLLMLRATLSPVPCSFDSGAPSLSDNRVDEYSKRPQWGQQHSDWRRRIVESS
jgi:hypothetical protein